LPWFAGQEPMEDIVARGRAKEKMRAHQGCCCSIRGAVQKKSGARKGIDETPLQNQQNQCRHSRIFARAAVVADWRELAHGLGRFVEIEASCISEAEPPVCGYRAQSRNDWKGGNGHRGAARLLDCVEDGGIAKCDPEANPPVRHLESMTPLKWSVSRLAKSATATEVD